MQLLGADCMHASWPAGSDRRLPKRCMYPGALALYSELDIGFGLRLKVGGSAACGPSQDQVSGQPRLRSVNYSIQPMSAASKFEIGAVLQPVYLFVASRGLQLQHSLAAAL